jgi:hypothetical protein
LIAPDPIAGFRLPLRLKVFPDILELSEDYLLDYLDFLFNRHDFLENQTLTIWPSGRFAKLKRKGDEGRSEEREHYIWNKTLCK